MLGPLLWFGPNLHARLDVMYGLWYFGKLTKLYAYGLMFIGFRYFQYEREGPSVTTQHPLGFFALAIHDF